jgi:hypothetical protein
MTKYGAIVDELNPIPPWLNLYLKKFIDDLDKSELKGAISPHFIIEFRAYENLELLVE